MKQPLLSISIASYNASWCLSKCLDSFVSSDNRNLLELIVVNDGSTDETLNIAEKYRSLFPEIIRVVNKQNGGHGSTVNSAINVATGRYFKVVDSDDTVDRDGLSDLLSELEKSEADIILSPYYQIDVNNGNRKIQCFWLSDEPLDRILNKDIQIENRYLPIRLAMHAITYKTEILKKNEFRLDENCFYVDTEYTMGYLQNINIIRLTKTPVYEYYVGFKTQSVERTNMMKRIDQFDTVANRLVKYYKDNQSELNEIQRELFKWNYCNMLLINYYQLLIQHNDIEKARKLLKSLEEKIKDASLELYERVPDYFRKQNSKLGSILPFMRKHDYNMFSIFHYASKIYWR